MPLFKDKPNTYSKCSVNPPVLSPKNSGHPRLEEAAELFDYNTDYYA